MLLAHRRHREADPPPGSQRDKSLTVRPGPKAFHAETLEIALVCTGVSGLSSDFRSHRFRERRAGMIPSRPHQARRVVSRGTPQGRAG